MLARKWYWIFFTSIVMLLCFVSFWQFQYLTNRNSGGSGLNISVDPKKFYSPLDKRTFIENRDRTNTVVISLTPSFFDLVHLVTVGLKLDRRNGTIRIWNQDGLEISKHNYYTLIVQSNQSKFWVTQGNESYRPINGVFYYLLTDEQLYKLGDIKRSLYNLEKNYNSKFGPYPIIIFHSLHPSRKFCQEIASVVKKSHIYFIDVRPLFTKDIFPDIEPFFNQTYTDNLRLGWDCSGGRLRWGLGYFNMIRFRTVLLWREPILQYFDYVVQIDSDIDILRADIDVFAQMKKLNRVFGYYSCVEDWGCTNGLYEISFQYAERKNVTWKHKDKIRDPIAYYGNFLIFKTSWFLNNRNLLDYFDFIDSTRGIYVHRWAEQVILPIALAMYLDYDQIYWIGAKYLVLNHYNAPYYPKPQKRCPNVSAEPDCCE
jgi:hypothetical protein